MADQPNVPLVVDLDGTIIRTDLLWESLARLLRRNPLAIFQVLYWWTRGRAWLKQQLAARVQVDPLDLPYHPRFIEWLRQEKAAGRRIILATASDRQMAQPVADHLGLFDEIMASDGKTNLRRENKRRALVERFGEQGFDYAGNSRDDLVVWRSARQAIVVNAPPAVRREAAGCAALGPRFCGGYSPWAVARSFITELLWCSGYLAAMAGGGLLALAFPKFGLAGFAWIAPALILAAVRGKAGAESFRVGFVSGLTFWLVSLYWLLLMPAVGFPILGWLALAAYSALYIAAWVTFMASFPFPVHSWSGRLRWTLGGAAAWVALELVRGQLFGGFPWSFLATSQYQLVPLLQIASATGVYGVSFLIVWFSLSVYSAINMILLQPEKRQVWQAEIVLPLLAVLAIYTGGFYVINRGAVERASAHYVRVTTIQPSVPQTLIWSPREDARRFVDLLDLSQRTLSRQAGPSDLLVWPESAVPDLDEPVFEAINQFARSNHVWIILNGDDVAVHPKATNYFNSAFLIGPDGRWRQVYHKRKLVIFGEYVPLADWLPFVKWLTPITGGWTPGSQPETFRLERRPRLSDQGTIQITADPYAPDFNSVNCAPLICFEDTFPGATRASAQDDDDFLVTLTNDGWFQESDEQWQHLANAVFRAVENGRPLLRCANNGITCLISDHGSVDKIFRDDRASAYGSGAFTVEIPLAGADRRNPPTFYHRHGDWFAWGCAGITALLLASLYSRQRKTAPPTAA